VQINENENLAALSGGLPATLFGQTFMHMVSLAPRGAGTKTLIHLCDRMLHAMLNVW